MTIEKAIGILQMENELLTFDPNTGDEIPYEFLNDLNRDCYDAHVFLIELLENHFREVKKKIELVEE